MSRSRLTRGIEFSAGHRYRRPDWSERENRERFGRYSAARGHGHNYRCEVTVAGEIDPETGMLIDQLVELNSVEKKRPGFTQCNNVRGMGSIGQHRDFTQHRAFAKLNAAILAADDIRYPHLHLAIEHDV